MDIYDKKQIHQPKHGRWGDTLPKMVPVRMRMEADGLGPAYDDVTGEPLYKVFWYTPKELLDPEGRFAWTEDELRWHLAQTPAGKAVAPDLRWPGSINEGFHKPIATDKRKNITPRKDDMTLHTSATYNPDAFGEAFGDAGYEAIGEGDDFNPD